MRIELFVWDGGNIDHIARHGLHHEEVDEVLEQPYRITKTREGRYYLFGRTMSGRYLSVVFESLSDGRARVVTARAMTETEKRRYERLL